MFEEGFSSIITWTAGVPDPAWLNIYSQAERLGNMACGVPSPQPDLSQQVQLHSHRVSAAQWGAAAAHQQRNDPRGLLSNPAPLPNSYLGSSSSDAPFSPPCEN